MVGLLRTFQTCISGSGINSSILHAVASSKHDICGNLMNLFDVDANCFGCFGLGCLEREAKNKLLGTV